MKMEHCSSLCLLYRATQKIKGELKINTARGAGGAGVDPSWVTRSRDAERLIHFRVQNIIS